jgi:eukaryotic-like serine/threonine-protein kinase
MNRFDERQIDALLDEAIQRTRRGEVVDIEDYCASYPALAGDLRLMLPALVLLEQPAISIGKRGEEAAIPTTLADFKIIREIGRGAMGTVYEAVQQSLGRRVALKVFRPAPDSRKSHLARFKREAETAARLHHSNIIPVFGSGESDGWFFCAMQLIEGINLQQLLSGNRVPGDSFSGLHFNDTPLHCDAAETVRYAQGNDHTPVDGVTEEVAQPMERVAIHSPNDCARIVLQVAEGLSFAHQHGVIHRDIKPSNIMLDKEGRAWIADFGLAKPEEGENLTGSGDIIGTLRYMAPESFQGESGPRGDIYSLGLTLFELLEGRPAHTQNARPQLIDQLLNGPPPKLSRTLPRDLETICHKCIEKDPGHRYQSAALLAEDLRRFLDSRPITARKVAVHEKIVRWSRRNPVIVSLVASLLVVGLVGAITAWRLSERASRLAIESKQNFEQSSQNLEMVLETVDRFCLMVSADQRLNRPEFSRLREQLLESAIEINQRFASDPVVAQAAKLQLARIHFRLGKLGNGTQDSLEEIEQHLNLAHSLLLELQETAEGPGEIDLELVRVERALAKCTFFRGEMPLAMELLQSSLERLEPLMADPATASDAKLEKARTLSSLGDYFTDMRRQDDAELAFLESVALFKSMDDQYLNSLEFKFELASVLKQLGKLYVTNVREYKKAESPFRESAALFSQILSEEPASGDVNGNMAVLLRWQAKYKFMAGDRSKAIETQGEGIRLLRELLKQHGDTIFHQRELALALRSQADFMMVADKNDPRILMLLDESERVLTILTLTDTDNQANVIDLASSYISHADLLAMQNEKQLALDKVDKAIPLIDQILVSNPDHALAREHRHFAAVTKAGLLVSLNQYKLALAEWEIAIGLAPAAFVDFCKMKRAKTLVQAGDIAAGLDSIEEILAAQSPDRNPKLFVLQDSAVAFAIASQIASDDTEDPAMQALGEEYAIRAVELLTKLLELNPAELKFVESSTEFDCLRQRDDFRSLLAAVRIVD